MSTAQDIPVFVPSGTYNVVRCLQLEGSYPANSQTGCWPITSLRVRRGWGDVPEEAWPNSALRSWPPLEPPGMDEIAKKYRIFRYQRIRNPQECLLAVRNRHPVMAAFEITREWFETVNGVIDLPPMDSAIVGSHQVTIIGADESFTVFSGSERKLFLFDNSWGRAWGVDGRGFLTWDFFSRW
jgi:hypothetical protein